MNEKEKIKWRVCLKHKEFKHERNRVLGIGLKVVFKGELLNNFPVFEIGDKVFHEERPIRAYVNDNNIWELLASDGRVYSVGPFAESEDGKIKVILEQPEKKNFRFNIYHCKHDFMDMNSYIEEVKFPFKGSQREYLIFMLICFRKIRPSLSLEIVEMILSYLKRKDINHDFSIKEASYLNVLTSWVKRLFSI